MSMSEPLSAVSAPASFLENFSREPSRKQPHYNYSRIFNPRLLGFAQTVTDPASVVSYCPNTGFSNTIWMHRTIGDPTKKTNPSHTPPSTEIFIDSSCILLSIAGRLDTDTNELTYAVFHGPGSQHNTSGTIPLSASERTRKRLHAELYACQLALTHVRNILLSDAAPRPAPRNIVVVTDSRRIMHAIATCASQWQRNGWTRARGRKPVPNAVAWQKIVALVEELEQNAIGVRFWTVDEAMNRDAVHMATKCVGSGNMVSDDEGYQGSGATTATLEERRPPSLHSVPQQPFWNIPQYEQQQQQQPMPVFPQQYQPNYFPMAPPPPPTSTPGMHVQWVPVMMPMYGSGNMDGPVSPMSPGPWPPTPFSV
ncbi:hypothetical protein EDC01DRAFT_633211 [Geopyxis carbonaria]|nr:hypothetical protein EDC01DRAFT_633211 [Geopyxis carbonaria]